MLTGACLLVNAGRHSLVFLTEVGHAGVSCVLGLEERVEPVWSTRVWPRITRRDSSLASLGRLVVSLNGSSETERASEMWTDGFPSSPGQNKVFRIGDA